MTLGSLDLRVLIPARSGSKSVPDKNIQIVHGHPMLAYSIAAASFIVSLSDVVVSTDSQKYADVASRYGVRVRELRPKHLAQDSTTDQELFESVLANEPHTYERSAAFWLHLRPTTPYRDPAVIRRAIELFISNRASYSSLRSCEMTDSRVLKYAHMDKAGLLSSVCGDYNMDRLNAPRQSFPQVFAPNGYVDIIRPDLLRSTGRLHGDRCVGFITDHVIDVDDSAQLDQIRATTPPIVLVERLHEIKCA